MEQSTKIEETDESVKAEGPMLMVVTLKSGTQVRMDVDEYTIQRNHFGALVGIKWQATDRPAATIEHLDIDEVAAVHTEWPKP